MSLGRIKNIDNQRWIDTMANIESEVSLKDIEQLEAETLKAIRSTVSGKKAAFAWSGGKDSIVLAKLCEKAKVKDSLFVHSELEYPEFLGWCLSNLPKGCEVINIGLDLKWLSEHPEMLFPRDSRTVYRWYQIVQQNGIRKYFREHELDMMIVGHRKADGNYTGNAEHISRNGAGIVRYAPLSEWTHEQVLAYIHYRKLAMPPIYAWENGYKCGTHSWPCRTHTKSVEDGFRAVYAIDRSIVEAAAEYLPQARAFLEEVNAG